MKIWKASRSERFNEATLQSVMRWRRDVRLIQERYRMDIAYPLADFICPALGALAGARVHNAVAPVLSTLERLEKLYAALGRG